MKVSRIPGRTLIAATLLICLGEPTVAQIEIPKRLPRIPVEKIPGLDRIPGLEKFLGKDAPITTGLADAITEVAFLDGFNPTYPRPLPAMDADGTFTLTPGAYSYQSQSYCIKAGTFVPFRGQGHLYAPMKGPKAAVVQSILRRSAAKPEIDQKRVQVLLWAVIARTKIKDMDPAMQRTVAELLTPREIFDLNGGALGLIPEEVKQKALARVPPSVQRVVEAENRIRYLLTKTNSTFDEIERTAVLFGHPPPEPGDRDLPPRRWSYHPDGFFVRYQPHGYSYTDVDLYVPDQFQISRDDEGRINRVADSRGNAVEIRYAPAGARAASSPLRAFPFASVKLTVRRGDESVNAGNWDNSGWTLVGLPGNDSKIPREIMAMNDAADRVQKTRARVAEFNHLLAGGAKSTGRRQSESSGLSELIDLAHLHDALSAIAPALEERTPGLRRGLDVVPMAWQASLSKGLNARVPQVASMLPAAFVDPGHDGWSFDPSDGVATPGATGSQRIAQSPRKKCDDGDICEKLGKSVGLAKKGINPKRDAGMAAVKAPFKSNLEKALKDVRDHACTDSSMEDAINDLLKKLGGLNEKPGNTAAVVANNAILKEIEEELRLMIEAKCAVSPPAQTPCPVAPLAPLSEDAERQEDKSLDESKLTDEMKEALACFKQTWAAAPYSGSLSVTSAYRSTEYQRHLYDLWKKYVELLRSRNPACDGLLADVEAEMKKHGVIGQPLNPDSATASQAQHPEGAAIDVQIPAGEEDRMVQAALCCNLYRPWPNDPVHFEVCPQSMFCTEDCQ